MAMILAEYLCYYTNVYSSAKGEIEMTKLNRESNLIEVEKISNRARLCNYILRNNLTYHETKSILINSFGYTESKLLNRDLPSLLRAEAKHYLVKEIQSK